ncbi:MAG: MBL fold metallo-hydrolase [Nocardiopsaceae bacterium]|nr:MBL fold metallo-hydrolase [Nocardiopsaceae bacterium]
MRLTVVGCAGSFPGPDSPASCYLLDADGFRLAIDFGNGALGGLQKYAGLFGIDAVVLSHLHADHCVDLYAYAIARTYAPDGPRSPVPVYGPRGTRERIAGIGGPGDDDGLMDRFSFRTLAPGTLDIGPFRVTAAHVNHPVEAFGFRFDHGDRSIAYSGDTSPADALVSLAEGADAFVCEASFLDGPDLPPGLHLTARQAAEHAQAAGAGQLMLTHLLAWNDPDASLEEAAGHYDGPLSPARTGLVVDLKED